MSDQLRPGKANGKREQLFVRFRLALFRAGIPFGLVKRYERELQDHLDDLEAEAAARNMPAELITPWACDKLGSAEDLATAIVNSTSKRSLFFRFPVSTLLFAPGLLYLFGSALSLGMLVGIAEALQVSFPDINIHFLQGISQGVIFFLMYLLPSVLAMGFILVSRRQRADIALGLSGVVLLAFVASLLNVRMQMPNPVEGIQGVLSIGVAFFGKLSINENWSINNQFRLILNLLAPALLIWHCHRAGYWSEKINEY